MKNTLQHRYVVASMELKSLLILEDASAMSNVVRELMNQGIPVQRFSKSPLAKTAEDSEIALYAGQNDMIVFTADTQNPSFTEVVHDNNKDLRPPDLTINKRANPSYVKIDTSLQSGIVETERVDPNKHRIISSNRGHNGVIRMFQQNYKLSNNPAPKIAKKTKEYLKNKGAIVNSQIKDIRI